MKRPCSAAPARIVDEVRRRIAPLFPDWEPHRIDALVCQIADVQWRYQVGSEFETRQPRTASPERRTAS